MMNMLIQRYVFNLDDTRLFQQWYAYRKHHTHFSYATTRFVLERVRL
jgi:hypothetical protein